MFSEFGVKLGTKRLLDRCITNYNVPPPFRLEKNMSKRSVPLILLSVNIQGASKVRNWEWTLCPNTMSLNALFYIYFLSGRIYITGGFNGQECMHSAEVYDPEINQWSLINPMRSRRSGVSCAAYHGHVYVIGGFNGISRMCSGEKYNPQTNLWSPIPDMYNPRSNFAIEVIDDMLFAIGGFNGKELN